MARSPRWHVMADRVVETEEAEAAVKAAAVPVIPAGAVVLRAERVMVAGAIAIAAPIPRRRREQRIAALKKTTSMSTIVASG